MDSQNSQIRLPLVEPKDGVMIGAETLGQPVSACGLIKQAAQRSSIDGRSRVNPKPNDPTCALVHDDEAPMRFESKRLTPEEIDTPQTIFGLTNEGKPGGPTIPLWAKVRYENSPYHVFIER